MPIMSSVTAGTLVNKKRIMPISNWGIAFFSGFAEDNNTPYDLTKNIWNNNVFPSPGLRIWTAGTPIFTEGSDPGGLINIIGDELFLTEIPHTPEVGSDGCSFGVGEVPISLAITGTHDFVDVINANNIGQNNLKLVHNVSDEVFNGGIASMNSNGLVSEYICPAEYTGVRCADPNLFDA